MQPQSFYYISFSHVHIYLDTEPLWHIFWLQYVTGQHI